MAGTWHMPRHDEKPRLRKSGGGHWLCVGVYVTTRGETPCLAYRHWKAWHVANGLM